MREQVQQKKIHNCFAPFLAKKEKKNIKNIFCKYIQEK